MPLSETADRPDTRSMEIYPEDEVAGCAADEALQRENGLEAEDPVREDLERMRSERIGGGADPRIDWIYFRSPEWTWEALCGREGWLLRDPGSGEQLEFVQTAMN